MVSEKDYRYHNLADNKGKNELFSCYNAQMKMEDFPMGYITITAYQNQGGAGDTKWFDAVLVAGS